MTQRIGLLCLPWLLILLHGLCIFWPLCSPHNLHSYFFLFSLGNWRPLGSINFLISTFWCDHITEQFLGYTLAEMLLIQIVLNMIHKHTISNSGPVIRCVFLLVMTMLGLLAMFVKIFYFGTGRCTILPYIWNIFLMFIFMLFWSNRNHEPSS